MTPDAIKKVLELDAKRTQAHELLLGPLVQFVNGGTPSEEAALNAALDASVLLSQQAPAMASMIKELLEMLADVLPHIEADAKDYLNVQDVYERIKPYADLEIK